MARDKAIAKRPRSNEEVLQGIEQQVAAANTVEEILGVGKLYNADDVIGEPLVISGWEASEGDFGEYALIYATRMNADGSIRENLTVSCGGNYVLVALRRIDEIKGFPFTAMFTRKETNQGFRVYRLEAISS